MGHKGNGETSLVTVKSFMISLYLFSVHPIRSLHLTLKFGLWQQWLVKNQKLFVLAYSKCCKVLVLILEVELEVFLSCVSNIDFILFRVTK